MLCKTLALALTLALPLTQALAAKYEIDPDHTKIEFKVSHLVISSVTGRFDKFSGKFNYDPDKHTLKDLEVEIDVASVNTANEKRDAHLRKEDFFHVQTHPKATFKLKGPVSGLKKGKSQKTKGKLSIRGKEKPEDIKITYVGSVTDGWGNKKLIFKAESKINRKDYDVNWNKNLDSGGLMVGEEVEITIEGQAFQRD